MLSRLLQSPWTATLVGTLVYLATVVMVWRPHLDAPAGTEVRGRGPAAPSWGFQNPEVDLLIQELKKERDDLAARKKELDELADRLANERTELQALTQAVAQIQAEFDSHVLRIRQDESANLKKVAKTYAAMDPKNAGSLFKALDEDTLVKVISFMRENEIAPIFDVLAKQSDNEAKRVAALCERIRLTLSEAKKTVATSP